MLKRRYSSTESLDGVIDLERLRSGPADSLERDARKFFELTYPSEDLHKVLRGLSRRFKEGGPGTILAQALKGLGKSHTLLLGYHLFASPDAARAWSAKVGYEWDPPKTTQFIVHKFTDQSMPHDALWLLIGSRLGISWAKERPPDLDDFRSAIRAGHLVLILDELERGIQNIVDPARRSQNISFLQMISEEAARDNKITLFAAVYDGNVEPGSTLKRTPRTELHFRRPEDRAAIVRHRLFENSESYDRDAAKALTRSYVNTWRRFGLAVPDAYAGRMEVAFPFLPDLIELIFERITESGGFQGTRSALGLLGAMLDATGEGAFVMTAADCRITDAVCGDRLLDLDPTGTLVNAALSNYRDLAAQPFAESIASSVLLASLVPGGRAAGLSVEELIRHVVRPGDDPNQFYATMEAFKKFGTRFHEREGRFVFDLEENEYAKIELDAIKYNDDVARDQIAQIWLQDVFRDTQQSIIYRGLEETQSALQGFAKRGQRYVIAPRRLSQEERFALYQGLELRNQVLLLEPRDGRVDHLTNPDLLSLAKKLKAARQLAGAPGTKAERRTKFEKIAGEQLQQIHRTLKSAGLLYIRIESWGDQPSLSQFEEEGVGQANSKEEVLNYLRSQVYPSSLIEEHLRKSLTDLLGQRVEQVDRTYRKTLGFPVPLTDVAVSSALIALAEDRSRILGLQHPRGNFCGERVILSESEVGQAVLAQPWPASPARSAQAVLFSPSTTATALDEPEAPTGTEAGAGDSDIPLPTAEIEERGTPHCRSLVELRQQVAARLTDVDDPVIGSARFTVFADYQGQDLSGLPAAYRGGLTGHGDVGVQIDVRVRGPMTKAMLEQHCERLPNLSGATCSVRFTLEVPPQGQTTAGGGQE